MSGRASAAVAGVTIMWLLAPSVAAAASRYCASSGDFCTGIFVKHGVRTLDLGTFSAASRYRLCVRPPDASATCKRFRLILQAQTGSYTSSVRWRRHFPDDGPGVYRVEWRLNGRRLGPVLSFRR